MNIDDYNTKLIDAVQNLVGTPCWSIIAGVGTWPTLLIHFGGKVPLKRSFKHYYMTEEERFFGGEYRLFIHCSWRIESNSEVVTSSQDSLENNALEKLSLLRDMKVVDIFLAKPSYDLTVFFSNGYILKVFCDLTNVIEDYDNWSIFISDFVYTVGAKSILKKNLRT